MGLEPMNDRSAGDCVSHFATLPGCITITMKEFQQQQIPLIIL